MDHHIDAVLNELISHYHENLTTKLGSINNRSWAIYFIIVVIFLFFAQVVSVSLSVVFFMALALVICYIIYSKQQTEFLSPGKDIQTKLNLIIPKPQNIDNYPDAVDFLYSTREYYDTNPNAYSAMVSSIDKFFRLYDQIINDKMIYCTANLQVAVGFSRDALNNLQSMIYNLYPDPYLTNKLQAYESVLHSMFQKYISRMAKKCNRSFLTGDVGYKNQYYQTSGPRAYNYYDYIKTGTAYTKGNYDARNNFKIY